MKNSYVFPSGIAHVIAAGHQFRYPTTICGQMPDTLKRQGSYKRWCKRCLVVAAMRDKGANFEGGEK